jgi:hypothetical protein
MEKEINNVQTTMETTTIATVNLIVECNDNKIVQAAVEESADTTPSVTMPTQTIDQILANTPAPKECEAAEALGELAVTTIEGSKTDKAANKRKTMASSPPTRKMRADTQCMNVSH